MSKITAICWTAGIAEVGDMRLDVTPDAAEWTWSLSAAGEPPAYMGIADTEAEAMAAAEIAAAVLDKTELDPSAPGTIDLEHVHVDLNPDQATYGGKYRIWQTDRGGKQVSRTYRGEIGGVLGIWEPILDEGGDR